MLQTWEEYKQSLTNESKKWGKVQYVGKDGIKVIDYPKLPLTLEGFYVYCYNNLKKNVKQYFLNQDNYYDDFIAICSRIKDEIRNDQIVGGLLGMYNPSITQRLNGISDNINIDSRNIKLLNIDPLDDSNDSTKEDS